MRVAVQLCCLLPSLTCRLLPRCLLPFRPRWPRWAARPRPSPPCSKPLCLGTSYSRRCSWQSPCLASGRLAPQCRLAGRRRGMRRCWRLALLPQLPPASPPLATRAAHRAAVDGRPRLAAVRGLPVHGGQRCARSVHGCGGSRLPPLCSAVRLPTSRRARPTGTAPATAPLAPAQATWCLRTRCLTWSTSASRCRTGAASSCAVGAPCWQRSSASAGPLWPPPRVWPSVCPSCRSSWASWVRCVGGAETESGRVNGLLHAALCPPVSLHPTTCPPPLPPTLSRRRHRLCPPLLHPALRHVAQDAAAVGSTGGRQLGGHCDFGLRRRACCRRLRPLARRVCQQLPLLHMSPGCV